MARASASYGRAGSLPGAFTLAVGGLKTIPVSTAAFVEVTHDGSTCATYRLRGRSKDSGQGARATDVRDHRRRLVGRPEPLEQ